ncbi:MAG: hypothetical protein ACRDBP_10330, partial [Luteolibacter sp.]
QSSDNGKMSNNSWIMSFAPYENPRYAICIMVQNGGSGGGVCGPLVNLVYRGLFARDHGVKLPLRPMKKFAGNTDRIETTIEITPDMIAAVEAGEIGSRPFVGPPAPDPSAPATIAAAATADPEAEAGETGEEASGISTEVRPTISTADTPTPSITPEVDAEGSVIPRAIPIQEN